MSVLIAANGNGARWGGPEPKVLAEVGGVPLVCRTMQLARQYGAAPFVLASSDAVLETAGDSAFRVPQTGSVCETLLAARDLWHRSRGALLLGDVWYGADTLADVLTWRGRLVRAWGDADEVYAVAWHDDQAPLVYRCCAEAVGHGGKLWHMLRVMDGLAPRSHAGLPSMLMPVTDGTRDFDRVEQFAAWLRNGSP